MFDLNNSDDDGDNNWELVIDREEGEDGEPVFLESDIDSEEETSIEKSTPNDRRYGFNGWVYQEWDVSGRQIAFQNYVGEIELGLTFLESLLQKKPINEGDKEASITVQFLDRSDIALEKIKEYRDFLFLLSQNRNIPVKVGSLYEDVDENIRKPLRDAIKKVNTAFIKYGIENSAVFSVFTLLNEDNWKNQSKKGEQKNFVKGALSSDALLIPTVSLDQTPLQLKHSPVNDGQKFLNSVRPFKVVPFVKTKNSLN